MDAGRELDALVAERVMGWARTPGGHPEIVAAGGLWRRPDGTTGMLRLFSTDMRMAWQVVKWAQRYGYQVTLHTTHPDTGQWVCVLRGALVASAGQADTVPLAICLAALRAVGVEV